MARTGRLGALNPMSFLQRLFRRTRTSALPQGGWHCRTPYGIDTGPLSLGELRDVFSGLEPDDGVLIGRESGNEWMTWPAAEKRWPELRKALGFPQPRLTSEEPTTVDASVESAPSEVSMATCTKCNKQLSAPSTSGGEWMGKGSDLLALIEASQDVSFKCRSCGKLLCGKCADTAAQWQKNEQKTCPFCKSTEVHVHRD